MKPYAEMSKEELTALRRELKAKYHEFQTRDLKLDMSRGKPSVDQPVVGLYPVFSCFGAGHFYGGIETRQSVDMLISGVGPFQMRDDATQLRNVSGLVLCFQLFHQHVRFLCADGLFSAFAFLSDQCDFHSLSCM